MAQEAGQAPLLRAERGPWTGGYTSAIPEFMARPDQLIGARDGADTNSSRDVIIDPFDGGVSKRYGTAIVNDAGGSGIETDGLLTSLKFSAKCRKIFAIDSPSLADNYSTVAALFSEDTNPDSGSTTFPIADTGFPGTIWLSSTNSGATTNLLKNYSLLKEFDSTDTYARSPSITLSKYRMKVVPIWMESGDGVYFRGALTGTTGTDRFTQQFVCAGSRSVIQTQDWLYAPNLRCTPWRWNKRFNESTTVPAASAYQTVRIYPAGPLPPLYPPTVTTPSASTTGTSWSDGDTFYLSVLFVRDDGSPSAPFIPRQPNNIITGGNGLVTVGTIGAAAKYQYLTYSNIPIGPAGTVKRVLLRSVKQTRTASTDNITVAPLDLRVIGVLANNTQVSFVDYGGDDDSLVEDDDFVDVDWTLPRRARYIGTGDSRAIISYTLPNTAAILLAPIAASTTTPNDLNIADDAPTLLSASTVFYIRITATDLELHVQNGATAATYDTLTIPVVYGNANNAVKFPLATFTTVESMVDAINVSLVANSCRMWKAQLAPGIDPTMATSSLTKTTFTASGTSANGSATITCAANAFDAVGVGMKVSGPGITLGTYVVSKTSTTAIVVSSAAGVGFGAGTFTFWSDTGDTESITVGGVASYGYMRAFCGTWPVLLHMKPSAFPDYATPDKASVYFTNASPGAASSGISLAPNSYTAQNRRLPHSSPRQLHSRSCTGIVDIEGAAIVAYSDGIYMFANQRGANTGEDFDCRLFTVNDTRGCISYLGLTAGNGWAAYPTTEGICVTDKNRREFIISGDIFNPANNMGDLAYEIGLSGASVASDSDNQYFSMAVLGSRLVVAVRNSAATTSRILNYNFSPGVEASGVEELLNPETKRAYIWGPPALYNAANTNLNAKGIGAMGASRISTGRNEYMSYDSNGSPNGDGRIEKISDTANTLDNTVAYTSYAICPPLVANPFMAIQAGRVEATHMTTLDFGGAALVQFAVNQTPTFNSTLQRTLNNNASAHKYQKQSLPVDQGQRGKTDAFWIQWVSNTDQNGITPNVIWRFVIEYSEVEN